MWVCPLTASDVETILRMSVTKRAIPGNYSFEEMADAAFAIRNFSRKTVYSHYEKHKAYVVCREALPPPALPSPACCECASGACGAATWRVLPWEPPTP